jgi:hypothetical protein
MSKKSTVRTASKGVRLTERYGKIGIPAVHAAAAYEKKGIDPKPSRGGKGKSASGTMRGTSPRR